MDANIVNSYVVPTAMGSNIALRHEPLINKAHCKMSANGHIFPHWGEKQTNTAWCLALTGLRELGWEMTNDCVLYWKFSGFYEKVEPSGHCFHKNLHGVVALDSFSLPFSLSAKVTCYLFVPILFGQTILYCLYFKIHQLCDMYMDEKINFTPK